MFLSMIKALTRLNTNHYRIVAHSTRKLSTITLFGPEGYVRARIELTSTEPDVTKMVLVENRPYFPLLSIDPTDESSMVQSTRSIVDAYYSSADVCSADYQAKVTQIAGGLTNALFRIDFTTKSVLVRIFGAEGMIDRDEESATFARLCGPPYSSNTDGSVDIKVVHPDLDMIGRFANGRVEMWIPNMKQSVLSDFDTNLMGDVARCLARLHHGFEVPSYFYKAECREINEKTERVRVLRPRLWEMIYSWIDELESTLSREKFGDPDLLRLFHEAVLGETGTCKDSIIWYLRRETDWLKSIVHQQHPNSAVAFTHNDLCTANILLDQSQESDPCIIDYEYGSINYTMYDIANFFCELCGGNDNAVPNFESFPSIERQRMFLSEYYQESRKVLRQKNRDNQRVCNEDEEITKLLSQIKLFQMASNLIWGVWGILQACCEADNDEYCKKDAKLRLDGQIDTNSFNNLRYGKNRLINYKLCKERFS